jgi:predicted ATPase
LGCEVLTHIDIENFRSLREVSVPLRPLTVLIGPNDSGKSSFLAAVKCGIDRQTQFCQEDYWRGDVSCKILIRCKTETQELLTRSVRPGERIQEQPGEREFQQQVFPVQRFQLPSSGIAMRCSGYNSDEERDLTIDADGGRVPALLDYLLRRDRSRFFKIVQALRDQIPGFEDLEIATPRPDQRQVVFSIENSMRIPADAASTGARLLLFFIAIAFHPRPPRTILIEEPETGLHPKRLANVVNLLRDIAKGRYGDYPAQIILTTHSPFLLDCVNLDNDQVIVFRRNQDGSRGTTPVDADRLKDFLDEFMLGEIWFNEEEAGLVAKT